MSTPDPSLGAPPTPSQRSQRTVALVGTDCYVQELLAAVLLDDGYAVRSYPLGSAAESFLADPPDALVLEMGRNHRGLDLLDTLRTADATSRMAVIALGTTSTIQAEAQASGNVHTALPMPFALEDLLAALGSALAGHPAEDAIRAQPLEPDAGFQRAADALNRAERALMLAWHQRMHGLPPFASRPDIRPSEFLDNVPRILDLVVLGLRHQESPAVLREVDEVRARVLEHARLRYRQEIPVDALLREYQELRIALRDHLRRHITPEELLAVLDKLVAFLDEIVRISAAEYVRLAAA